MKRILGLLLTLIILVGSFPFLSNAESTTTSTDDIRFSQAVSLGLLDGIDIQDKQRLATRIDVVNMITAVQRLRFGDAGRCLASMAETSDEKPATRFWFGNCLYLSWTELCAGIPYDSNGSWIDYADSCSNIDHPLIDNLSSSSFGLRCGNILLDNSDVAGTWGSGGIFALCTDVEDIIGEWPNGAPVGVEYPYDFGDWWTPMFCDKMFDRVSGEKILEMDEDGKWRPQQKMTIQDAAEATLRYYNSFEPEAEYKTFDQVSTFDSAIITPELLSKETTLPKASCSKIPEQWHGILFCKWGNATNGAMYGYRDKVIRAEDLDAVKAAGLNSIVLMTSFSLLQGPETQSGMVNETRLKELDQVIAYAIERDIHITIQCLQTTGFQQTDPFANGDAAEPQTNAQIAEFAQFWGMLARRYAAIPNEYLAFNLFCEPGMRTEKQYAKVFTPAVKAIRESNPDRVIIADIHSGGLTGKSMAELGVALSYHQYEPRSFCALVHDQYSDEAYMQSVTWPYKDSKGVMWDADTVAKSLLDKKAKQKTSYELLKTLAEKYNVGFTVGEFGVFYDEADYTDFIYPQETFLGYVRDMLDRFKRDGVSWTYGSALGSFSPIQLCRAYDLDYESVGSYYFLYSSLCDLFRSYADK